MAPLVPLNRRPFYQLSGPLYQNFEFIYLLVFVATPNKSAIICFWRQTLTLLKASHRCLPTYHAQKPKWSGCRDNTANHCYVKLWFWEKQKTSGESQTKYLSPTQQKKKRTWGAYLVKGTVKCTAARMSKEGGPKPVWVEGVTRMGKAGRGRLVGKRTKLRELWCS